MSYNQAKFILRSPSEVTEFISLFGAPSECTQLEAGRFLSAIHITSNHIITRITFSANKKVLITGEKPKTKLQFCHCTTSVNSKNNLPEIYGENVTSTTIAGFGQNLEAHVIIPAGVEITYYSLPKIQLLQYASSQGFESFLELTEKCNHIHLKTSTFLRLAQGLKSIADQKANTDFGPRDLLLPLSQKQTHSQIKIHNRINVAHQFIRWCHKNIEGNPPSLDCIAKQLFVSRRTLILAVQDYFDQGPAELLKNMRLQHCHAGLIPSSYRPHQTTDPLSVSQVMELYGFKHRGAFAKSFKDYFGYTPKDTINQFK